MPRLGRRAEYRFPYLPAWLLHKGLCVRGAMAGNPNSDCNGAEESSKQQCEISSELPSFNLLKKVSEVQQRGRCQPALLYGDGFSEERRKETTLTEYLRDLETWHPAQAAMLVCGLKPEFDCTEIPSCATGLDGQHHWETSNRFHDARRVLAMWNSRISAPARVSPSEFVAWCREKGVNTDWLREVGGVAETTPPKTKRPKLTGEQRERIVALVLDGKTQQAVADQFGVSRQRIGAICAECKKNSYRKSGFRR